MRGCQGSAQWSSSSQIEKPNKKSKFGKKVTSFGGNGDNSQNDATINNVKYEYRALFDERIRGRVLQRTPQQL